MKVLIIDDERLARLELRRLGPQQPEQAGGDLQGHAIQRVHSVGVGLV
jgi:DNA-binding LytR/AlgR family response regulator